MKITLEIPDQIVRRVKREAKRRRISVDQFVAEALVEKAGPQESRAARMKWAGALSHLKDETARINAIIEEEFEQLD